MNKLKEQVNCHFLKLGEKFGKKEKGGTTVNHQFQNTKAGKTIQNWFCTPSKWVHAKKWGYKNSHVCRRANHQKEDQI